VTFPLNSSGHSIVDMDRGKDKDTSTVPRTYPKSSNAPATLGNLDEISVLLPPTKQTNPETTASTAATHKQEVSYFSSNEDNTPAEPPKSTYRSIGQRIRAARRPRWPPFMVSWGRKWKQAVKARANWPRSVYGVVGLVLLMIWIAIT
jgi:hypothetical protein